MNVTLSAGDHRRAAAGSNSMDLRSRSYVLLRPVELGAPTSANVTVRSARPAWARSAAPGLVNGLEPAPPAVRPDNDSQEDEEDD